MQLYGSTDYKSLLESINSKMLTYSDASTFLRQVRSLNSLIYPQEMSDGAIFTEILKVL
jgi:hypothetical protein